LFERIATETEEVYQNIIKKLESFGITVLRPTIASNLFLDGKYLPPPMTPRDFAIMIGETFYENYSFAFQQAYKDIMDPTWPACDSFEEFLLLPTWIQEECNHLHKLSEHHEYLSAYDNIFKHIRKQGNKINSHRSGDSGMLNGAMISRIGRDLYFGTTTYDKDTTEFEKLITREFPNTRNHIVNTGGHSDGTYCPVTPGLIISLEDVPTYADTFPDWEVVYLPGQSWSAMQPFLSLKDKNKGKWWIPGFEHDQDVIDTVEQWLGHWTGFVEETVFDVNMLIIDPKNVMVFNYNKLVFDALERYGITPHVVPFRHRYFWDGGIHCVTLDLHREGVMQDYFPERNNVR
jgi:hypothetical protein